MSEQSSPQTRYFDSFAGEANNKAKLLKALELALDIRKFEIELYWKRATYFWAFTGASLVGYLTVLTGKDIENRLNALLFVSCLGLVFSVAWYLVNRASKFWQSNWEAHVDMLEDEVMGPVYKTVLDHKAAWWKIADAYPFSVTKINQLLSFFVAIVFLGLVLNTLHDNYILTKDWEAFPSACAVITLLAILTLIGLGRTGQGNKEFKFHRRSSSITEYKYDDVTNHKE